MKIMDDAMTELHPLDQAIRLAQRYGEDGADAFVNGVLDRIASDVRENGTTGVGEK